MVLTLLSKISSINKNTNVHFNKLKFISFVRIKVMDKNITGYILDKVYYVSRNGTIQLL